MAHPTAPGKQRGLAFLALLIVVAAMGASLAATGTFWHEVQQRAKEQELIFVGRQYRNAIRAYYLNSPSVRAYPQSLNDLLRDERFPGIKRHLRRPYRDPLTNSAQWGIIQSPSGGIMGIYSLAPGRPIKRSNFPLELGWMGDRQTYADWTFVYLPPGGQGGF